MADNTKTVTLDFEDWRYDSWDFEVQGTTYTIEKGGTEVPESREEEIKKEAQKSGLVLRKV